MQRSTDLSSATIEKIVLGWQLRINEVAEKYGKPAIKSEAFDNFRSVLSETSYMLVETPRSGIAWCLTIKVPSSSDISPDISLSLTSTGEIIGTVSSLNFFSVQYRMIINAILGFASFPLIGYKNCEDPYFRQYLNLQIRFRKAMRPWLNSRIQPGLHLFLDQLDPEILKVCRQTTFINVEFYNWLAVSSRRLQFAQIYPSLRDFYSYLSKAKNPCQQVHDLQMALGTFPIEEDDDRVPEVNMTQLVSAIDRERQVSSLLPTVVPSYLEQPSAKSVSVIAKKFPQRTQVNKVELGKLAIGLDKLGLDYLPISRKDWATFGIFVDSILFFDEYIEEVDLDWHSLVKGLKIPVKGWYEVFKYYDDLRSSIHNFVIDCFRNLLQYNMISEEDQKEIKQILNGWLKKNIISLLKISNKYHEHMARYFDTETKEIKILVSEIPIPPKYLGQVRQLRSAEDFEKEGHEMNHCVAGYYSNSAKGKCVIFSIYTDQQVRSTVEFEVDEKDQLKLGRHSSFNNRRPTENHAKVANGMLRAFRSKSYSTILSAFFCEGYRNSQKIDRQTRISVINRAIYSLSFIGDYKAVEENLNAVND